jgi:CelD/BcsL family acetyltransferase involved in cellulose biosynthesis
MTVFTIRTLEEVKKLESEWLRLQSQDCYSANPFINYYRMCAWLEMNEEEKKYEVKIVVIVENDRIVLIAPFAKRRVLLNFYLVYFAGAEYADYGDVLIESGYEYCIEYALKKVLGWFGIAVLRCVSADSIIYKAMRSNKKLLSYEIETTKCPYIEMGNEWATFPDNLDKSLKRDITYNIRRLSHDQPLEYIVPKVQAEKSILLNDLFSLHTKEWNSRGKHSIFENPYCRRYYELLLKWNNIGDAKVYLAALKAGEEYVGIFWGQRDKNRFYYYKPAYNYKLHKYSPGKILLYYLIEECLKDNIRYFDFLVGVEPYKLNWTETMIPIYAIFCGQRNTLSWVLLKLLNHREHLKINRWSENEKSQ